MTARRLRTAAFTFFAGLFALASLLFLEGLTEGLMPWVTLGCPGCPDDTSNYPIELAGWGGAIHGAVLGVLFAGALIGLLWRARERPLLLQFYALGHVVLLVGLLPFRPATTSDASIVSFVVGVILSIALLFVLYPERGQLFTFSDAHPSPRLLGAAMVSAIVLAPFAIQNMVWQLSGFGGIFAEQARWIEAVVLAGCLLLASLLTATRRPGWQALGVITSLAYIYLGLAAITVPVQPGSPGIAGGIAAIAGGLAYAGLIALEARQIRPIEVPSPQPAAI